MANLSIIILSYNTKEITERCLNSLINSLSKSSKLSYEIIVVDNGSNDGSVKEIEKLKLKFKNLFLIKNKKNIGYPRGNNQASRIAQGKYILFLNSDVVVDNVDFNELVSYLDKNGNVGVLTVKVNLPNRRIDPASHRGFPTLWNAFCYFSKLEKVFGRTLFLNKFFGGYHLTYLNLNSVHEINSPSGAFYLTRKVILNKIGGFDERFFMYGEDLDLSYRIKKLAYKIIYYPKCSVTHFKYASGLAKDKAVFQKTRRYFYDAMKVFYKKHYENSYPQLLNDLVYKIIDWKSKI